MGVIIVGRGPLGARVPNLLTLLPLLTLIITYLARI